MDTQYLKMILALPYKFFEGWEYKLGDSILIGGEVAYTGVVGVYRREVIRCDVLVGVGFESDIRPIPSQEQLQNKIINHVNKKHPHYECNDFTLSKKFIAYVIEGDLVQNIENKPLKVMWLEFAEYVIYGKTWDGEAWI